jgi:hypothetical protein
MKDFFNYCIMKKVIFSAIIGAAVLLSFHSCGWFEVCEDCCDVELVPRTVNPNIIRLPLKMPCALWLNDSTIYGTRSVLTISSHFLFITKTTAYEGGGNYMYANAQRTKFLFINGAVVYEFDVATGSIATVLEQSVMAAVYYKDDNSVIYCTPSQEFYLYDRLTQEHTLLSSTLLSYAYEANVEWYATFSANGFDVLAAENKLIVPIKGGIVEYDMVSKKIDTLNVALPNESVWVRCSSDGSKILYSNVSYNHNEVGIINRRTGSKTVLDANASPHANTYCLNMFPNWSPDEKHIIFGSAESFYFCMGSSTYPQVYMLKDVGVS